MNNKVSIISTAVALVLSINLQAAEEDKTYLTTSDGSPVVSSSGECVMSSGGMTAKQLEACGYQKPVEAKVEIVATETAATVTTKVEEKITFAAEMLFDFDSSNLTDNAKLVIDERIDRFKGRVKATTKMQIVGHTDSSGPEEYNQKLSEKRAQAVADYILAHALRDDMTADKIQVTGKGESEPTASNDTREGRMQNRRVDVYAEGVVDKLVTQ
jgi:outer membrane protein OmpA-like peptidoglycan-associated protein